MSYKYPDIVFAILSPFFSSVSTVFQAQATKLLHPIIVASIGAILGSLILFLVLILQEKRASFQRVKKNYKELLIMTVIRPILGQLLLVFGLSLTTGIKAIFFTKTEPFFVLFWHWVFKREKIKTSYFILLAFHITGAVILSTGKSLYVNKPQFGDLLIVLAVGLFSLSYLYGKTLATNVGSQLSNAITLGAAGIILSPFILLAKPFPYPISHPTGWFYLLVSVLLFNVIGLTFWFSSLKTVPAWIVSALRALGPLVGAPVAYLLFKETLNLLQVLGGVLVIATSFLIVREHLKSHQHAN